MCLYLNVHIESTPFDRNHLSTSAMCVHNSVDEHQFNQPFPNSILPCPWYGPSRLRICSNAPRTQKQWQLRGTQRENNSSLSYVSLIMWTHSFGRTQTSRGLTPSTTRVGQNITLMRRTTFSVVRQLLSLPRLVRNQSCSKESRATNVEHARVVQLITTIPWRVCAVRMLCLHCSDDSIISLATRCMVFYTCVLVSVWKRCA